MNHFLETGILKKYLDEKCGEREYKICAFKDRLGHNLMWDIDGPLYQTGGWEANKKEYDTIIKEIITDPSYLKPIAATSLEHSSRQLFTYDIVIAVPQLMNTAPYGQIAWRYRSELPQYQNSSQNQGTLRTDWVNKLQDFLIPAAMLLALSLALFFAFKRRSNSAFEGAVFILIAYYFATAIVCANFSTVDARYENRVVWVFPLFASIGLISLIRNLSKST